MQLMQALSTYRKDCVGKWIMMKWEGWGWSLGKLVKFNSPQTRQGKKFNFQVSYPYKCQTPSVFTKKLMLIWDMSSLPLVCTVRHLCTSPRRRRHTEAAGSQQLLGAGAGAWNEKMKNGTVMI